MANIFVSYINKFYIRKYLLMHESLSSKLHSPHKFVLYAFDIETIEIIRAYKSLRVEVIAIELVEERFGISRSLFSDRSDVEYMFTLGPLAILYTRMIYPSETITFVDSDYFFFDTPIDYLQFSAGIDMRFATHSFPPRYKYLETHGHYNVGWNTFFPTSGAYYSLRKWAKLTIEWCRDQVVPGRFAEQKYLDYLHGPNASVEGIDDGRMGLAEYNFFQHDISISSHKPNSLSLQVNGLSLISWHFHGIKETPDGPRIRVNIEEARRSELYRRVYGFYITQLESMELRLSSCGLSPGYGNLRI